MFAHTPTYAHIYEHCLCTWLGLTGRESRSARIVDVQMVSLLHLAEITEEGVTFRSPVDGRRMLLTPEESMGIQNRLGAPWQCLQR